MKRFGSLVVYGLIGGVVALTIAGWWHELVQADKRASTYIREKHPRAAEAAKRTGDQVRSIVGN